MSNDHAHHHAHAHGHASHQHEAKSPPNLVKDPVCGMDVDPLTARFQATFEGRAFYFCSQNCHDKFKANPEQYVAVAPAKAAPTPAGTIW